MRIPRPYEEIKAQKAEGHEKCGRLAPQRRQQHPHRSSQAKSKVSSEHGFELNFA